MTLEVGKTYYLSGSFGDETMIIVLNNNTKFPDQNLNAIKFVLEGNHVGLGRRSSGVWVTEINRTTDWTEITDKNAILNLQRRAITTCFWKVINHDQ